MKVKKYDHLAYCVLKAINSNSSAPYLRLTRVGGGPISCYHHRYAACRSNVMIFSRNTDRKKTNCNSHKHEAIMKRDKERMRIPSKNGKNTLRFREIGRGFIMTPATHDLLRGRHLITAYADQYNRSYILVNGKYELITEQQSYLAVD